MGRAYSGKDDLEEFQKCIPRKKEYVQVVVSDFFHNIRGIEDKEIFVVYDEIIAKLCYVCSNELVLHIETETGDNFTEEQKNSRAGSHQRLVNNKAVITPLRLDRELENCGFELKLRLIKSVGLEVFVSERMLKLIWDGEKSLKDYKANTIVELPLFDFPNFKQYFWPDVKRTDEEEGAWGKAWWKRVDEIIKDFKPWLFLPIVYCKEYDWRHAGAHRMVIARELGMKTIDVRIEQHKSWGKVS